MSKVIHERRKSMVIRPSGRSTDYISPSFGWGCLFDCSYCYMKRHKPEGLSIANNTNEILTAIDHHAWFADVEKPNQTHENYVTYDISCNEDFALHSKYHEWEKVFAFFRDHPKAMASFATKYVNGDFLKFDPHEKVRIRFSLMPEKLRKILEPNTSEIEERLMAVELFQNAGYEVHLNFSPVVMYDDWRDDYAELFRKVATYARTYMWDDRSVKAEVIFLTHNERKHEYNVANNIPGEDLLWTPSIQETKISEYGGGNLRYISYLKDNFIQRWTELHNAIIPWNTIRYIF